MSSCVKRILAGELNFSREELEEAEQELDEVLEAPETDPEEEEAREQEEVTSDEITEANSEIDSLDEAVTSLEELVGYLQLESAPLTPREYNLVMAQANQIIRRTGMEDLIGSFESESAEDVPREDAAAAMKEKSNGLGTKILEAIKAVMAKLGEWWNYFFDNVVKTRRRLVGLAKAYTVHSGNEFSHALPTRYQAAMADDLPINLGKAYQSVMVQYVSHLGHLAFGVSQKVGVGIAFPNLKGLDLPGAPNFARPGNYTPPPKQQVTIPEIVAAGTFVVNGNIAAGEKGQTFEAQFGKSYARSDIGRMIAFCDMLAKAKSQWEQVSKRCQAELDKALAAKHNDPDTRIQHWLWMRLLGNLYDSGPKRFVKYAAQVLMLRAQGYAIVLEKTAAPETQSAPANQGSGDRKLLGAPA